MCLYPRLLKNRKYTETKKNGGEIPTVNDLRTLYVPIGCQICMECRKKKAKEWQIRLQEDIKTHKEATFVTLTLSNESYAQLDAEIPKIKITTKENWKQEKITKEIKIIGYKRDNQIATLAAKRYLERWRKKYRKSIRHWLITELGHNGTENIHIHGLIYTKNWQEIKNIWNYGFIYPRNETEAQANYVNNQTINYITKYVYKTDETHQNYTGIILCSPGIGGNYTQRTDSIKNKYKEDDTDETYRTNTGHKISLPIYYRNKIYTETEREKLWIEKLNKQERWILGNKIDISKGEKEYNKALIEAQNKNNKLGYNNPKKAWKREKYEEERRIMMQEKRIFSSGIRSKLTAGATE